MIESFILGAVQGISEWLPISSEAMIILVKNNFFYDGSSLSVQIKDAIFLHIGTLLAALIYFRKTLAEIVKKIFTYRKQNLESKKYLNFLFLTTIFSGIIGLFFIKIIEYYDYLIINHQVVNIIVSIFLLFTATVLYYSEKKLTGRKVIKKFDCVFVGIAQGLAAIPGISRSGSTIGAMGIIGFDKVFALKTSFILSIPLVFMANIVLNFHAIFSISTHGVVAIVSSCLFGLITISALLRLVEKIAFSYFVAFFGVIVLLFGLLNI